MPDGSSPALACLIATTSGRILLLWDQDATLPFRYPQLAMLLASIFHFSQAQPFCTMELQGGFTLLISSDTTAQISVAVICATPTVKRDELDCSTVDPLQLARLKSLIIMQEFVRCYRDDIDRLAAESVERSKLMAEQYTLTSALDGFEEGCDGTLDEFVGFQSGFVNLVMETPARGILNSIVSWCQETAVSSTTIRLARGFLMNAETGDTMYSTQPDPNSGFFGRGQTFQGLYELHRSARVHQTLKAVSKAMCDGESILTSVTNSPCAAVVVRFNHVFGGELSELFVALRMLPVSAALVS